MEQQQRLKIESMEALLEENDKKMAKLEERKKKLETDNKELHEVCLKKQAENEQLKKSLAEKTATIEQLKKSSVAQSKIMAAPTRQTQYIVKKNTMPANTTTFMKEKENSGPTATIRTASIDLHDEKMEPIGMKPQLQEAYNKLIKEIKGKNEVVSKKRTDSFHCTAGAAADKKKVNTTINPYVTQAWEQTGTEPIPEEIFKKTASDLAAFAKSGRAPIAKMAAAVANKSTISEERTHLRSNSHRSVFWLWRRISKTKHGIGVEDKQRATVDSSALASIMRHSNCKDLMEKYKERPKDKTHRPSNNSSQMDKSGEMTSRPKTSMDKYQGRPSTTYREMCRERSISNSRGGVLGRQSQPTKLVKAQANATSIMRVVDQL